MINNPASLRHLLAFGLLWTIPAVAMAAGPLSLSHDQIRLTFDPEHGRLVEFRGQADGHNFAGPDGSVGLWQAVLLREDQSVLHLTPAQADKFGAETWSRAGPLAGA